MEKNIWQVLHHRVQKFIADNMDKGISQVALKHKSIEGVPIQLVLQQIQGKQKARYKLPTWYNTPGILFPPTLNLEQCSSEITAEYKSTVVSGKALADLTGGFGIDGVSFSRKFAHVCYVERDNELVEIVKHNFSVLNIQNITTVCSLAEDFLKTTRPFDVLYLDPARRDEHNNRVFKLEHCEPNVVQLLPALLLKSSVLMIKTSPLLDIKATVRELTGISQVHVVSVENECKEVLYLLDKKNTSEEIKVICVNLLKGHHQSFEFSLFEEENSTSRYGQVLKYLYEPNASILKAGAFNHIGCRFGLTKLHPNSHLYTSQSKVDHFPGRKFEVLKVCKYDKREIFSILDSGKANVTVRNFPDSVDQVRKKLGLKDGGEYYLFATTDINKKHIIIVTKKAE